MTAINAPIRIGRAVVLPGDLVLAKTEGVLFIPAILAEEAISTAEFTGLKDDYNFELNREGKNGAEFEGGWTGKKYDGLAKWIDAHPDKLKMPRSDFDAMVAKAKEHADPRSLSVSYESVGPASWLTVLAASSTASCFEGGPGGPHYSDR